MRSRELEKALKDCLESAAGHLQGELAAGAEVSFELSSRASRGRGAGAPLYCYRALTGAFIEERWAALAKLPACARAAKQLEHFDGLDRYLASAEGGRPPRGGLEPTSAALRALLQDVFAEQTDFELRPERLGAALARLERSALAGTSGTLLVGTLHGLTLASAELRLSKGLTIAHPEALEELPAQLLAGGPTAEDPGQLVAVVTAGEDDEPEPLTRGRETLTQLLRALRLFGDGRVALGAIGWARIAGSAWMPLALGRGGRPHGMLVVTTEQEDELRAFCNLVSRRAPRGDELAWALRRFELGCEHESPLEGLSDHLAALRALLEPEGPASGMLPSRLAALCAKPEQRPKLAERAAQALALERSLITGAGTNRRAALAVAEEMAEHLRALLSDVICGHLEGGLAGFADELMAEAQKPEEPGDGDAQSADAQAAPAEEADGVAHRERIVKQRPGAKPEQAGKGPDGAKPDQAGKGPDGAKSEQAGGRDGAKPEQAGEQPDGGADSGQGGEERGAAEPPEQVPLPVA